MLLFLQRTGANTSTSLFSVFLSCAAVLVAPGASRAASEQRVAQAFDPQTAPAMCQGRGFRVAGFPGLKKTKTVQQAEVCRLVVEGSDATLSVSQIPGGMSAAQVVQLSLQAIERVAQSSGLPIEHGDLELTISELSASGFWARGMRDAQGVPRVAFFGATNTGGYSYIVTVEGPQAADQALAEWFDVLTQIVILDGSSPKAPLVPPPSVPPPSAFSSPRPQPSSPSRASTASPPAAIPKLGAQRGWKRQRFEKAGIEIDVPADYVLLGERSGFLSFASRSSPTAAYELRWQEVGVSLARQTQAEIDAARDLLGQKGVSIKVQRGGRRLGGVAAKSYLITMLDGERAIAMHESLCFMRKNFFVRLGVSAPFQDKKEARRRLGHIVKSMRLFAPLIEYNDMLSGQFCYIGTDASREVLTFDGAGGLERYFEPQSHIMPNGSFYQGEGSTTQGRYAVHKNGTVRLEWSGRYRECEARAEQGRIYKLDCGGYYYAPDGC